MSSCSPDCSICHGLGYVSRPSTGIDDPNFGKIDPCPESLRYSWDPMLGIEEAESALLNWSLFQPSQSIRIMQKALNTLADRGYGWLYLWGEPGLGKTVSAKTAVIEAHYKYKKTARYLSHSRMINFLRSSYDEENGQSAFARRLDSLADLDYLTIDEVGRDRSTDFGVSAFSDLLDRRYVSAISQKTITVFLSNFPPEKVLSDYQLDRVMDGRFTVLQVQGRSMRSTMTFNQPRISSEVPYWKTL